MEDRRTRLVTDHEALRELTARLEHELRVESREAAGEALDLLTQRFRRCVREEEEQVLPALEQLTGVGALTRSAAVRSEHRVLLDLLGTIDVAVKRGDLVVAAIDLREFSVTHELHMKKELAVLDLLIGSQSSAPRANL